MRDISYALLVIIGIAVAASIHYLRQGNWATGFHVLAPACLATALLLAFIYPVQCRVTTRQRGQCRNQAYGVIFGCGKVPGHRLTKFYWGLGGQRSPAAPAVRDTAKSSSQYPQSALTAAPADTAMAKCCFWITVGSAVIGLVSLILALH